MKNLTLQIRPVDISRAKCGNRRQCVIAHALDRQLGLHGHGYVRVDANGMFYTHKGFRHQYTLPLSAVRYLRRFDEIGERLGPDIARASMEPTTFKCKFVEVHEIPPPADRARKDQINAARRARGTPHTALPRYVGV